MPAAIAPAPGTPGYELRQRRLALGLTQDELAERAGVSQTTISTAEANESRPSVANSVRIARALEYDDMSKLLLMWEAAGPFLLSAA